MTQLGCFTPVFACRVRIGRQDASGAPLVGANNLVVSSLVKISYSPQIKDGTLVTLEDGCGSECLHAQKPDKVSGLNLQIQFCTSDYELDELISGARLVMVGDTVRGSVMRDINEEVTSYVSIEAWAEAWEGNEQAVDNMGNPLYTRYVFPRTTWVPGDREAGGSAPVIQYNGKGYSNSQFGTGPGDDLPDGVYVTPKGEYVDDGGLPDANCGYLLNAGS